MAQTAVGALLKAQIHKVWQETPTVKGLRLKLDAANSFSFQPGQWVDFHVPGLQNVGGYSICSSPQQLKEQATIDLCVKSSKHPCASWVHSQATVGAQVYVQVGGTFVLTPDSSTRPCLFVAGGIGITALSSMIGHLVEQQQAHAAGQRPMLLFSAAAPNEFALLQQLLQWQRQGSLKMQLHTTKTHGLPALLQTAKEQNKLQGQGSTSPLLQVQHGRIGRQHLESALQQLRDAHDNGAEVVAYVCGPPKMTDDVVHLLGELGLATNAVHTERWW